MSKLTNQVLYNTNKKIIFFCYYYLGRKVCKIAVNIKTCTVKMNMLQYI